MTKKRFVNKGKDIFQYGEWWCSAGGEHCADVIATAINELIEENEQLKQFQDRVFSWIDMHLQRLPTLIDKEFNSDNEFADPSLYSGALQILETMKKELKGDLE